ncbi:MAG: Peptidoglycan/LPS O-acetylase OafA/YrhL, contains acyltransferase and SGNH-hydrolase domain [Mucilaginibacter sp.]|nr:Peptidoglycan/LPS O-acetylase OafA/YrhL, contains acyltransferase and SGNH-hydrolase domain [Mucilaginibacter sp.]
MICDFHVNFIIDYLINVGQQGVVIFFVISGFILPYSLYKKKYVLKDFFSFLLRRSIRIDPPYWCIIALPFIIGVLPISLLNLNSVLLHLFYLVPFVKGTNWFLGVFWTLAIEFQFYLLLGIFFPFLIRIKANVSILILICINIICILSKLNYHGVIIEQMSDFVIGFIAFMAYVKRISLTKGLLVLFALSAYIMVSVSIKSGAVPLSVALFILLYKSQKEIKPLYFLGNISYSLYLIHFPLSLFLVGSIGSHVTNKSLLFGGCLLLSILSAYIFYLLVERYALKLSKMIKLSR